MTGRIGAVFAALIAIAGCTLPSQSDSGEVRFHGEATDPAGDTAGIGDAHVARPPDLVHADIQVTDGTVRLTVRFAPGSLAASTEVWFDLDTDLDLTTGQPGPDLGSDYAVVVTAGPLRQASIARAVTDPGCSAPCRFEPFLGANVLLSTDEMAVVIPRSAFVHFDGRLNFRVIASAALDARSSATSDNLPNFPEHFVEVR